MHVKPVEIYSDETNSAVMRHPDRAFPGLLVQGDTLYALCQLADAVCVGLTPADPAYPAANKLRNALWSCLNHYKSVLDDHDIGLPFSERPIS